MPRLFLAALAVLLAVLVVRPAGAGDPEAVAEMQKDQPGAHDFAAAGRYEGAHLLAQTVKAFDELTLPAGPVVSEGGAHFKSAVTARGRVTRTLYVAPAGRSTLEILVNYEDSLKAAGYEIAFECAGEACGEGFADIEADKMSGATSLASMMQQLSNGMGVAVGAVLLHATLAWRGAAPSALGVSDIRIAFAAVTVLCLTCLLFFLPLRPDAGAEVSGHGRRAGRGGPEPAAAE